MVVYSTNFVWTLAWLGCYANLWELWSRIWCCQSIFIIRRKISWSSELKLGFFFFFLRGRRTETWWVRAAVRASQRMATCCRLSRPRRARKAGAWGLRLGRTGLRSGRRQVVSAGWRWAGESQQKAEPRASRRGCHGSSAKLQIYLFILIEIEKKHWYWSHVFCY